MPGTKGEERIGGGKGGVEFGLVIISVATADKCSRRRITLLFAPSIGRGALGITDGVSIVYWFTGAFFWEAD